MYNIYIIYYINVFNRPIYKIHLPLVNFFVQSVMTTTATMVKRRIAVITDIIIVVLFDSGRFGRTVVG